MENERKDFFISYTEKDEQWALWIAGTLEMNGYTTINMAWDFKTGHDFAAQMQNEMNNRERYIIVLSKEYLLKKGWSQREWTSILAKDPALEKGLVIPVWIENLDAEKDNLGMFATIIAIRLYNKSEKEAEKKLLEGVSTQAPPRERPNFPGNNQPSLTETKRVPFPGEMPFDNFSFKQNKYFTGRDKILTKIYETFKIEQSILVLEGLGGVGKSEIAKQYAFLHSYEYDCIWWINAESENLIIGAYTDFAHKCEIINQDEKNTEIIVGAVKNWMQHSGHNKWLFIFDNAEKESMLEKYLPTQTLKGSRHILITTRYTRYAFSKEIGAASIPVDVFEDKEATDFLTKRTQLPKDDYSEELAKVLGYLALALEHAAAFILVNNRSYKYYLNIYNIEMLKKKYSIDDTLKPVFMTWKISIDQLGKEEESPARQLFNLCVFFAPDNIIDNWFVKAVDVLPPLLQKNIKNEYDDVKAELKKYSLVTITNSKDGDYQNISIHRLLQNVVKDTLKDKQEVLVDICMQIMYKQLYYDFSTEEYRNNFREMSAHVITILNQYKKEDVETANLYHFLGYGFDELADYDRALEYNFKALAIREKVLGKEHPDTATTYSNMATVYHQQGDYDRALKYFGKALVIDEKVSGKEHPDTATTYNNIAGVYDDRGDYDRALEYYGKALTIKEKVLGKEHPSTATTYNNMALVYDHQGDYDRALEYNGKALAIREKVLGKEHPDTATTYNNMAGVYTHQGDYDRALEYYGKALAIREKVVGKEHPDTATTYNNMAVVYRKQGDYNRALEWYLKALLVFIKVLGPEHPNTNTLLGNIYYAYERSGKPEPFEEWLKKTIYYLNFL